MRRKSGSSPALMGARRYWEWIATHKDGYVTPTGVTPVGDIAWVSEGQLDYLFDPARHGQKPRLPFKLFAVPLPK